MKINGVRFNDKEVSVLRAFVSKVIEAGLPSQFDIRACDMTEVDASEFENKLFEAQLNISRTSSDFTIRANPIIDAFESDATANHKIHDVPTSQIEILDEVDSGLFGKVYKARQTDPGRAHLISPSDSRFLLQCPWLRENLLARCRIDAGHLERDVFELVSMQGDDPLLAHP